MICFLEIWNILWQQFGQIKKEQYNEGMLYFFFYFSLMFI